LTAGGGRHGGFALKQLLLVSAGRTECLPGQRQACGSASSDRGQTCSGCCSKSNVGVLRFESSGGSWLDGDVSAGQAQPLNHTHPCISLPSSHTLLSCCPVHQPPPVPLCRVLRWLSFCSRPAESQCKPPPPRSARPSPIVTARQARRDTSESRYVSVAGSPT
jgi:hypothetical protein